jgi:polyphosphate kinase
MNSGAFVNRELSWLEFNRRVLEEAQDPSVPLLERVKFLAIFSSNLDEFFMVRVAALKRRIHAGHHTAGPDGLTPAETTRAVAARVRELADAQHRCFLGEIQPLLIAEGILLRRPKEVTDEQEHFLEEYFRRTLLPVLTPLAVDPGHPFPYLGNRSPCLVVSIRPSTPSALSMSSLSVIHLPNQVLPRFVALPDPTGKHVFMLLEDVIRQHLPSIYNGYDIVSSSAIRVTRDADLHARGGAADLLASIEEGVRERRLGTAVRLQYDADLPSDILAMLLDELELSPEDLYEGEAFTAFSDLFQLYAALDLPRLKDRPLPPQPVPAFESASDVWTAIRAGDVLAHHPYHAFDAVTRFVHEAAVDPKVLAIKMTLYRVSPASPIAHALRTAVENGKEVTVLVELQARFDEEANIRWARALEEVGAPTSSTAAPASRLTARRASSSGKTPMACDATVTSPPGTTTYGRAASTAISGSSPAATRSATTSPRCSISSPVICAHVNSITFCSRPRTCAKGSSSASAARRPMPAPGAPRGSSRR